MGAFATQGNRLSDWLKAEEETPDRHCRESVTILAGQDLVTGSVVGKITASSKYVAYDTDAVDGSQTVAGILISQESDSDTAVDVRGVILARGPAAIIRAGLTWGDDVSAGEITTAMLALKALGIIERGAA